MRTRWLFLSLLFLSGAAGANVQPRVLLEEQFPLWSLLHLETKNPDLSYPFPRRRGDFRQKNLRALRAQNLLLQDFDFTGADLRGADFTGSRLRRVSFEDADLREALLLTHQDEEVRFNGKTRLPFSKDEALRRGWREAQK